MELGSGGNGIGSRREWSWVQEGMELGSGGIRTRSGKE